MASLTLLHLLLMISAVSAWSYDPNRYRSFSGSQTFTPKGQNPDGTYGVELRSTQTTVSCYVNDYQCLSGNCGYPTQTTSATVAWDSYGLRWCQQEVVKTLQLNSNLPFEIRYPSYFDYRFGKGYWVSNVRSSSAAWRMMAHVDLGTRSDTGDSNRSPIMTVVPILRVPRNCPRSFNLTVFDPDGDHVRCRTASSYPECGLCGLSAGFSLDQESCSLQYSYSGRTGYHPIELVVEDFPNTPITLSYSDGSSRAKTPPSAVRVRRDHGATATWTTAAPTTAAPTTAAPTTAYPTTAAPTTAYPTTAYPTTAAPTTAYPTTAAPTTAAPTTAAPTTAAPTTAAPTTAAPTTAAPTTAAPTTAAPTTAAPTTAAPTTAAPTTAAPTTAAPTTAAPYTAALSALPLQFTVQVDSHFAPSCLDGDYFPIFVSPTPRNGVNLPAFVNQTLEIKVRSKAQYTTINGLIVTGPKGISKRRISTGEYIITWTPSENELNDHFPICFVSEATDRYGRVYQSELRCVTADVAHHETIVTCNETTIMVEVEKSYLIRRNEDNLHLMDFNDASCDLTTHSNSTHLVAVMSLNTCGTFIEEDEENIIFKNEITSADPNEIISRQHDVEIAFFCAYPKQTNLTLGFTHKNPYAFTERGFGAFTFEFEFFESQRFRTKVDSSTYPVEVYLKQMMFMQIEATTSIPNTELFVESCRATPYDNPNSPISYTIIEHGCARDNTVQIYPSSNYQFRFGMEAFEFIGAHEQVYITCSVILCETGLPNTRCSQGCISSGSHRSKRDVAGQTARHSISQGPLHLVKTSDSQVSGPSLSLGMNLVFIVGCLLVCGAAIYQSRRSKAKYHLLPTSETD
uniref:uncharacterized protein LOC117260328 n=1 Tax=Epinephelus lanceolatus TaxID=310571 RepID=UPI0014486841|nr:uncharacterized protein LOC117260328 [Epinephelus lanceolatus]